jgi:hypothetical protein
MQGCSVQLSYTHWHADESQRYPLAQPESTQLPSGTHEHEDDSHRCPLGQEYSTQPLVTHEQLLGSQYELP